MKNILFSSIWFLCVSLLFSVIGLFTSTEPLFYFAVIFAIFGLLLMITFLVKMPHKS